MAVGMLCIQAMHHRFALRIGFNAKGSLAVAVCLHLLAIEGLNLLDRRLHRIDHVGTVRPVVGKEVDHPHGARFAHVQIRQPLGRRARLIAPPLFAVVGRRRNARCRRAG